MNRSILPIVLGVLMVVFFAIAAASFYIVDPGHVGVQVVGGNVTGQVDAGWGFVNPASDIVEFDCREKTEDVSDIMIRSQDQLETRFDISIQYRANKAMASKMLAETGELSDVVSTHLIPKFRGLARDAGRQVPDSKQFFTSNTQASMTAYILDELTEFVAPKGLIISAILIRQVDPPAFIEEAVQRREEREQATEQQQAELARFKIEQEQKVAAATAERDAAILQAEQIRALAAAEADAVALRGKAIAANPVVLKLEYIQAWDGVLPRIIAGKSMNMLLPVSNK